MLFNRHITSDARVEINFMVTLAGNRREIKDGVSRDLRGTDTTFPAQVIAHEDMSMRAVHESLLNSLCVTYACTPAALTICAA